MSGHDLRARFSCLLILPLYIPVNAAIASALPADWPAWHSLKIHIKAGDFAEADYVIADPARGMLVLEVKGGTVRKRDGVWLQNERPMKMPPLDQAHRFVRILLGEFGARAGPRP